MRKSWKTTRLYWWCLVLSPTGSHENHQLECSWLGNPCVIHILRDLVKKEALDIFFLQKTRLKVHEFDNCKCKLGFANYLAINCSGRRGVALLRGEGC